MHYNSDHCAKHTLCTNGCFAMHMHERVFELVLLDEEDIQGTMGFINSEQTLKSGSQRGHQELRSSSELHVFAPSPSLWFWPHKSFANLDPTLLPLPTQPKPSPTRTMEAKMKMLLWSDYMIMRSPTGIGLDNAKGLTEKFHMILFKARGSKNR